MVHLSAYITEDGTVVPHRDHIECWVRSEGNRIIKQELVDGYRVSTVFLVLNHGYGDEYPQWFETMVFSPDHKDLFQERCATKDEALQIHEKAKRLVETGDISTYYDNLD